MWINHPCPKPNAALINICLVQESPVAILCDVSIFSFSSDQPANIGCHCNSQARLGTSFSIKTPPCQLGNFHYEDRNSHGGGLYLDTEPSMQVSAWSDTVAVRYSIWYRDRPQWLPDHRLYRINISSNVRWYGMQNQQLVYDHMTCKTYIYIIITPNLQNIQKTGLYHTLDCITTILHIRSKRRSAFVTDIFN